MRKGPNDEVLECLCKLFLVFGVLGFVGFNVVMAIVIIAWSR